MSKIYNKVIIPSLCVNLFIGSISIILSLISSCTNFFDKHRIQDISYKQKIYNHLPLILFNIIILQPLMVYYGFPYLENFLDFNQSNLLDIFIEAFLISLIDDTYFYWFHRFMHTNKYLFNKIHYLHHKAKSPNFSDYIYVHPLELIFGSFGIFISLILLNKIYVNSFLLYLCLRQIHEIDIHSGINSIFLRLIPFLSRAEEHDKHHFKFKCNYASTYIFWDKICDTKNLA